MTFLRGWGVVLGGGSCALALFGYQEQAMVTLWWGCYSFLAVLVFETKEDR